MAYYEFAAARDGNITCVTFEADSEAAAEARALEHGQREFREKWSSYDDMAGDTDGCSLELATTEAVPLEAISAYRQLVAGLLNMMLAGRLLPEHVPDDYQWLDAKIQEVVLADPDAPEPEPEDEDEPLTMQAELESAQASGGTGHSASDYGYSHVHPDVFGPYRGATPHVLLPGQKFGLRVLRGTAAEVVELQPGDTVWLYNLVPGMPGFWRVYAAKTSAGECYVLSET